MSKCALLVVVALCVVTMVVIWVLLPASPAETDAARYQKWKETEQYCGRVIWWERHLPNGIARLSQLSVLDQTYWDEHERIGDNLVASGFLTNATIIVAAVPTNTVQWVRLRGCFRKAFQGRNEWEFSLAHGNAVVVTCRPQGVFLCRQALEEWDRSGVVSGTTAATGL